MKKGLDPEVQALYFRDQDDLLFEMREERMKFNGNGQYL
jgi:hypothetical protein